MLNLLDFVQIIFESVPISSSGHTFLISYLLDMPPLSWQHEYQLHSITAVVLAWYFRTTWYPLLMQGWRWRVFIMRIMGVGICAESTTVFWYSLVHQWIGPYIPLWIGFLITMLILGSLWLQIAPRTVNRYVRALCIGSAQGIAAIPGVSRLAITYTIGIWLGLRPRHAFAYSCMIQWPIIVAGAVYGWYTVGMPISWDNCLLIKYAVAAVVAYYVLYGMQWAAERGLWKYIAFYMLIPLVLALTIP